MLEPTGKPKLALSYIDEFGFETRVSGDLFFSNDQSQIFTIVDTLKRFLYACGFAIESINELFYIEQSDWPTKKDGDELNV